jgi:hypothetical protein
MKIPSMEKKEVYEALESYASTVRRDECIVEVGSWFGAGTYHLCQGAIKNRKYNPVYIYDQWEARKTEREKALAYDIVLKDKENILPYVKKNLSEFVNIIDIFYNRGKIQSIKKFDGPKIGLYVDDASKRIENWNHSLKIFKPHFSTGCILILQDFYYFEVKRDEGLRCQINYMTGNPEFTFIKRIPGSLAAVYKYNG